MKNKLFFILFTLLFCQPSLALEQTAKFKYSLNYSQYDNASFQKSLNFDSSDLNHFDFRYNIDHSTEKQRFVLHYNLALDSGSAIVLQNKSQTLLPSSNSEDEKFFNLKSILSSLSESNLNHQLDRFYYGYYADQFTLKIGRQAISLGNGLIFQPLDMVNPFAPDQLDKDYKPGIEMLYWQKLNDDGSDLSLIAVPRRNLTTKDIDTNESSILLNGHFYIKNKPLSLMIGQDRNNAILAVGSALDIEPFTFQSDLLLRQFSSSTVASLVINAQTSFEWRTKMIMLGFEYFHNGVGQANLTSYSQISANLKKLLTAGQVFNLKQNYFATNAAIQYSELTTISPLVLVNLDDSSLMISLSILHSLSENSDMAFSLSFSPSKQGTEFGGLETSSGSGIYLQQPLSFTFEYKHFF